MSKSRNRDKDYSLKKKFSKRPRYRDDDDLDDRRLNQMARNGERFDDDDDEFED